MAARHPKLDFLTRLRIRELVLMGLIALTALLVVTNPPFSLFREYLSQLVEHDKKFLIIGPGIVRDLTIGGVKIPTGFGLLDKLGGVVLPSIVGAFGIFMMTQYMQSLPDELIDAVVYRLYGLTEEEIA